MGLATRLGLYKKLEARRKRPLIVYVTSNRVNANGQIAGDSVPEILDQLQRLPPETKELDLLIVSDGGDPTVAWRIVSLIRERAERFSALVPHAAYSAATLIVLGADEVIMHPNGNLGPTDPQIRVPRSNRDGVQDMVGFGSEDLMAFLRFSREQVGLKDPDQMLAVFSKFCDEVTALGVGVSARSALLSRTLGEQLLLLHMKGEAEKERAKAISGKLTKDYFHHGYPVNRSEATEIGLKVAPSDNELNDLMWKIWSDLREELSLRQPHNPLRVLADNPNCQPLFAPVPVVQMPANLPPALAQQIHQQVLAQAVAVAQVPPAPFELIHAVVESTRHASRFVTNGLVVGTKTADNQIRMSTLNVRQQWTTIPTQGPLKPKAATAAVVAPAPAPVAAAPVPAPPQSGPVPPLSPAGAHPVGKKAVRNPSKRSKRARTPR